MNASFRHNCDLFLALLSKELKVRYKGSVIGYIWALLQPLIQACMLFFAFKIIMRFQVDNYLVFLIAALFPWQFFGNSVSNSSFVFLNNASIIKKVPLPKVLLLLSMIASDMIHLIIAIPVIILFMVIHDLQCSWILLYSVPILTILTGLLIFGFSCFSSILNLFFRDTANLILVSVQFLFYLTPIIYPASMVPEDYLFLFNMNPLAPLFTCWRSIFLYGMLPIDELISATILICIIFTCGLVFYLRTKNKIVEVL